jgi:acyl-CoA synthetase (AMP-forming)/AMP-acid ligase II
MGALSPARPGDLDCAGLFPRLPDLEDRTALYAASGAPLWTRAQLRAEAGRWSNAFRGPDRRLTFLLTENEPAVLAALLGAISAGDPVALLDAAAPAETLRRLAETYKPDRIIGTAARMAREPLPTDWSRLERDGLAVATAPRADGRPMAADLAVLLSTSGTTGSAKFVRLTGANLAANAGQIAEALGITARDVAVAHLPLHYSYGLSVVTSHLRVGAAVHLWPDSVTTPEFWAAARQAGATHFPGVPFHYNFLGRGDLLKIVPETLRTFTQAGGALDRRIQTRMHDMLKPAGGRFYVMYGQTEAAPRMTTLPAERLPEKLGSVGVALAGGELSILDEAGQPLPAGQTGQVVYQGPNVMLGYAETREDLGAPDVMDGRLETGDLGYLDAEGYLFLTGRLKRFAKLYGLRISLDEVEARFRLGAEVAAIEGKDKIALYTEAPEAISALVSTVAGEYKIPANSFSVREIAHIPRKSNGKVDYPALDALP